MQSHDQEETFFFFFFSIKVKKRPYSIMIMQSFSSRKNLTLYVAGHSTCHSNGQSSGQEKPKGGCRICFTAFKGNYNLVITIRHKHKSFLYLSREMNMMFQNLTCELMLFLFIIIIYIGLSFSGF